MYGLFIDYTIFVKVFVNVVTYPDTIFAYLLTLGNCYTYAIARFVELEVAVSIFLVEVALFFEHTDDFITVELPDRFAHHSVGQRFISVDARDCR